MDWLNDRRKVIDEIDGQILDLLKKRKELVHQILAKKAQLAMSATDSSREEQIVARYCEQLGNGPIARMLAKNIIGLGF